MGNKKSTPGESSSNKSDAKSPQHGLQKKTITALKSEDGSSQPSASPKNSGGAGGSGSFSPNNNKSGRKLLTKTHSTQKMPGQARMRTLIISKAENHALIFMKPHVADNETVRIAIEEHMEAHKCELTSEGTITSEEIVKHGMIDKHYAALSKNAMTRDPDRVLSQALKEEFFQKFNVQYTDGSNVLTLPELKEKKPSLSAKQIDAAWSESKKLKVAGGVYVGRLEKLEEPGDDPLFVVNGFYAAMREEYVKPGSKIVYFTVEWKEKDLSWADFRKNVIGATDPSKAHPDSIRAKLYNNWEDFGLSAKPDMRDNCVHASAGPIEAAKERSTWIRIPIEEDPFALALKAEGIPLGLIQSWCDNVQVEVNGKTGSSFDLFEDCDSSYVFDVAKSKLKDSIQARDDVDDEADVTKLGSSMSNLGVIMGGTGTSPSS